LGKGLENCCPTSTSANKPKFEIHFYQWNIKLKQYFSNIYPKLGKKSFGVIFAQNLFFLAITFQPETLESQSKAQETLILA